MIRKILLKFSSLLLKSHSYITTRANAPKNFTPYILKHQSRKGEKKIIHIIANFIIGGSTQLLIDIIEGTSDTYIHSIVVPKYSKPLPYQPVNIHSFSINEMTELFKFLDSEKPEFVHVHYYIDENTRYEGNAFWYYAIFKICEDLKIKVIQNINIPTQPYPSSAVVHNVFVSKYVQDNFNSSKVSSSVIYPGSNFNHFKNENITNLPSTNIGMVYRLDYDKLNSESIEVFISAVKKKPNLKCYIIGGGFYLIKYKSRVKEEKLTDNFIFTGFVSYKELPNYYRKFSIFVAPVHNESFGQVTPFAMSMGLSIAGYDVGALSEILGYKDTLVEPGNVEKLANLIIDLTENSEKRIQLGNINQRTSKNFSVESMVEQYKDLYSLYCK